MPEEKTPLKCVKCDADAEYVLHGLSVCKKCMDGFRKKVVESNSPIIKPEGL